MCALATDPASKDLAVLTLFVTSICNAKCETCFYWHTLNQPKDEMTLDEWRQVARTVPPIQALQLSGGEPTLDRNLADKVDLFVTRPETRIAMPTNGIRTRQVVDQVRAICTRHPENEFIVGVSIDGPGEMHDAIRGVPGNFEKCLDTLAALQGMQLEFPKLRTSVLVTLMKKNIDAVPAMLREFADTARVDFLTVEVLRDQTPVEGLEAPPIAKLAEVHGLALELNRGLLAARQPDLMPAMISSLEELYRTQRVVRMTGLLDLDCQAGAATAVLEANGTVRLCELLESVGNVKEHGYDFGAVWSGDAARAQRAHILTRACSCTHCVNVGQSIPFDRTAENRRLARQRALEAAAV